MTPADLERLQAAGVYDPAAEDAGAQRDVLAALEAQGVGVEELLGANRVGGLVIRAFEHLIRPGERLASEEVAVAAGVPVAFVRRVRRAWGFPDPRPGERCWTPADVEALQFLGAMIDVVGEDLIFHSARATGTAMSRIAESEIALIRSQIEAPMWQRGAAHASVLARYRTVIDAFLPSAGRGMEALHRAHLVHLARRYTGWASPTEHNVLDVVVGFADLTGSTALVQRLDLAGLDRAITAFEERTSDRIAAAGATVVKRLGDGVMFVALAAEGACRLALDLVDAFAPPAAGPPVRVGLAAGPVAALRGDFFGPAVHLAARIVTVASPGAAFVSADLPARSPGTRTVAAGEHRLAGFDAPVPLWRLVR